MKWGFPIGLSVTFWTFVGFIRSLTDRYDTKVLAASKDQLRQVAVCLPAHNEARVIRGTIRRLTRLVHVDQIYVVSDGSTDHTAYLAAKTRVTVFELKKSLGKASALVMLFRKYNLLTRYKYLLIVDADTLIDKNYLKYSLPLFENPKIVAVAAHASSLWPKKFGVVKFLISSYRSRLYFILQIMMMYGLTSSLNAQPVIPGFASLYPTKVLKKLKLNTPGLAIEDFNMAFQVHKKKLGRIIYYPFIRASAIDPITFEDYISQVSRWNLGFFQTIKHFKVWPSYFWLFLAVFSIEMILTSILVAYSFSFVLVVGGYNFALFMAFFPQQISYYLPDVFLFNVEILIGFIVLDYIFTVFAAAMIRKPWLLVFGWLFFIMRFLDSMVLLAAIPKGFLTLSSGRWVSPGRR